MKSPLSRNLSTNINVSRARQWWGRGALLGWSEKPGLESPNEGTEINKQGLRDGHGELDGGNMSHVDNSPLAENENEMRRRIYHRVKRSNLYRFLRNLGDYLQTPEPTTEEIAFAVENAERRKLDGLLRQEVSDAARMMKNKLTSIGICRRRMREGVDVIIEEVHFDRIMFTPNAFYFHVGGYAGKSVMDLYNDQVCTDLSESVGRRVRSQFTPDAGLLFILERASTMGIPEFVKYQDMLERMPKDFPPLGFPAGVAPNGRHIRRDLADAPHLLIAGGSGKGKSNEMNAILSTLLARNTPADVRLALFDLKGGVEFSPYYDAPHLLKMEAKDWTCNGVVETPSDVLPALQWLMEECQKRLSILKKSKHKNIREFNRGKHPRNRLSYIVAAIDEFAVLKTLASNKCEDVLAALANVSRATGIHFIIATQTPKAEILNTKITVNFQWRMAYSMPPSASQVVLGSWDAVALAPAGRMIFQTNDESVQVQSPRITNSTVRAIVAAAKSGKGLAVQMTSVDAEEVIEWALNNLSGRMTFDPLFKQFGGKLTKSALMDLLTSMDNQTFDLNGALYLVEPGRGSRARTLRKAETT